VFHLFEEKKEKREVFVQRKSNNQPAIRRHEIDTNNDKRVPMIDAKREETTSFTNRTERRTTFVEDASEAFPLREEPFA
jgi:hypothetical protein